MKRNSLPAIGRSAALVSIVALASCSHTPDETVPPELPVRTVQLSMSMDLRYGGHVYDMNSVYEDDFGHVFLLDTLRFLTSGAQALGDEDVLLADYPTVYMMMEGGQENDEHLLGQLTAASLHEITFYLGLPPATNHADPAQAQPPLNDMSMHSGTMEEGYSFLHVAGRVDSNGDGIIDATDQRFSHRCIGDLLLCPATTVVHADLPEGGLLTVQVPVDMEVLLADIDLLNTPSSTGNGAVNWDWMQRLMDAIEEEH